MGFSNLENEFYEIIRHTISLISEHKLKKSSKVQPALEKQIYYPVDPSTYTIDRNFNVHQNLMQEPRLNPVNAISSSHGKGKGPGSIVLNAGQLPLRR